MGLLFLFLGGYTKGKLGNHDVQYDSLNSNWKSSKNRNNHKSQAQQHTKNARQGHELQQDEVQSTRMQR